MKILNIDSFFKAFLDSRKFDFILSDLKEELFECLKNTNHLLLRTNLLPGDDTKSNEIFSAFFDFFFNSLSQDKHGSKSTGIFVKPGNYSSASYTNTNLGFNFHNDGTYINGEIPHYMGLACIRPAQIGGESVLISGESVYEEVLKDKDTLRVLTESDFYFDTGEHGLSPFFKRKIIQINEALDFVGMNYFRVIIEQGHAKAGIALTEEQVSAVNKLDRILLSRMNDIKFRMESGDFLIADNRKMLHGRMPFKDMDGPSKRHMLRYWGNQKS